MIRWGVIILVLTLGFGQLLRFQIFGIPVYLHDVLVLLLIISSLGRDRLLDLKLPPGLKLFILGLAVGWIVALVSLPWAGLLVPLLYSLRLIAYLTLYLLLRRSDLRLPYWVWILSTLTTFILGLAQYLFLPDMRWAQYLGWDDHLHRLVMPHYDPNFAGSLLALGALTVYPRAWLLALGCFVAILLTYSRSTWLALLSTALLISQRLWLVLAATAVLILGISLLPVKFGEGTNLTRLYSIESRLRFDLDFARNANWRLVTGSGLNVFARSEKSEKGYPDHVTGPNNSFLFLLATTGVLGLVGWLQFWLYLLRHTRYAPLHCFVFVASFFNNVLFYPFVLLWLLLLESTSSKVRSAESHS